ncbi:adenylate/guanylate cyclase with GAF and PAS/PAC sensor [Planoprotostelium fungivorum]|uniref:Adenylate/guanylate cyclase with GAF and PAS/PAC sensor n=1 Tax=Planoprotostelium fungivorum TaxID=1890364 RepID=A0A2P6NTP4_9EUKA|nr:adenylate/guanylate cyclase with GAF and PAS/PAC sensor [Planoprotostelium fungivorum]
MSIPSSELPPGVYAAAIPPDEEERMAALHEMELLDSPDEEVFDGIVEMTKKVFGVPMVAFSIIDSKRQFNRACVGIPLKEFGRELSWCAHAILQPEELFIIPDALQNPLFNEHPFVKEPFNIRFYAGCPVLINEKPIGMLCILDTKPRNVTEKDKEELREYGQSVINAVEMRKAFKEAMASMDDDEEEEYDD